MPVRIGVVGFGAMGVWHARAAARLRGLTFHSICDVVPAQREAAAAEFGCAAFGDLRPFVADPELDAVVVATPSHAHGGPIRAALKAGKPVLCEKPLVQTEREACRLFDLAEKHGVTLTTFQNRRYDGHYLTTRKVVESGQLGPLHDIRFCEWVYTDLMKTFGVESYRPGWRSEAAYGGGTLLDFGPHYVDQVLQLLPQPVLSVFAILQRRRWTADADDQFLIVLRCAEDITVSIEVAHAAQVEWRLIWAITGAKGGYRYVDTGGELTSRNDRGAVRQRMLKTAKTDWEALYRNFRDVVQTGAAPLVKPAESLRVLRILDAARRSATTGRAIKVRDIYAPATVPH